MINQSSKYMGFKMLFIIASTVFGGYNIISNGMLLQHGQRPWDFTQYYAAATIWAEGQNPYDYTSFRDRMVALNAPVELLDFGFLYPPQTYWVIQPFAVFGLQAANDLFAVVSLVLWLVGMALLSVVMWQSNKLDWIGISLILVLLANIGIRDSYRWGQINAFLFIGLVLGLLLLLNNRHGMAGVALSLVTIKPQIILILIVVFAFRRDWRLLTMLVVSSGVFCVMALILTRAPVIESLIGWLERLQQADSGINIADPDVLNSTSMINIEVLITRLLGTFSDLSQGITLTVSGIIILIATVPLLQSIPTKEILLLDFALGCSLGLVLLYNRWHGMFALLPAVLVIYLHIRALPAGAGRNWWVAWLAAILSFLIVPNRLVWAPIMDRLIVDPGNWFLRNLLAYHAWVTLGINVSLIYLRWRAWFNSGSRQAVRIETAAA